MIKQKVVVVALRNYFGALSPTEANQLLDEGWRVVSSASGGTDTLAWLIVLEREEPLPAARI